MATTTTTTKPAVTVMAHNPKPYAGTITNYEGLRYLLALLDCNVTFKQTQNKTREYTVTLPNGATVVSAQIREVIEKVLEQVVFACPPPEG